MTGYLISQVAQLTQMSRDTLRFYEKKGLIQPPLRGDNGYRYYSEQSIKRLTFIQHCRALDMSLMEIQTLVDLEQQPNANCSAVNELIQQHLTELDQKIEALNALRQQLQKLNQSCQVPNTINHCQILKILEQ